MIERLKRLREPLATLVLVVVGVNIVAALVRVGLNLVDEGVANAMRREGGQFMGLVSVLFVCLAVGACALLEPTTRHARLIARVGYGLVVTGTVLAAIFLGVGLFARQTAFAGVLEAVGGITDVALKAGACYLLWQFVRRLPRPAADEPRAAPSTELEPATTQPVAPRDQAAGARWSSAREAAGGGLATWGDNRQAAGDRGTASAVPASGQASTPVASGQESSTAAAVVAPRVDPDALNGPAAKADPGLWRT